jgi:hypothetical protein
LVDVAVLPPKLVVTANGAATVRVLVVSVTLFPGVAALPVSAPVKVSVYGPPAVAAMES